MSWFFSSVLASEHKGSISKPFQIGQSMRVRQGVGLLALLAVLTKGEDYGYASRSELGVFDMPNPNRYDILSISIFCKIPLSISIFSRMAISISISISIFFKLSLSISISIFSKFPYRYFNR